MTERYIKDKSKELRDETNKSSREVEILYYVELKSVDYAIFSP